MPARGINNASMWHYLHDKEFVLVSTEHFPCLMPLASQPSQSRQIPKLVGNFPLTTPTARNPMTDHRAKLWTLLQNYHPIDPHEQTYRQRILDFVAQHPDCFERS